ncbi:MAG: hypothetical protein R3208_15450 [Ketobacteraceae bacterium]|nr:hypothetical protein [Ketobacteraceae bacterium]
MAEQTTGIIRCLTGLLFMLLSQGATAATGYDPKRLGYTIQVGAWKSEYEIMSFFVLPEQELSISILLPDKRQVTGFRIKEGDRTQVVEGNAWNYKTPKGAGLYPLQIDINDNKPARLNIFVMRPASEVRNGVLNGYRIGTYPKEPYKKLDIYLPPKGFVEVTKNNQDTWLSPHYQLKQFVSKQGGSFPRYVVMKTRLLRKLEFLTEVVNKKGIATSGFHIMSGYRTPYYNTLIKNKIWSRHQWGGAADIFIDEKPRDNYMDDINMDGKINVEDSKYLASLIEAYFKNADYQPFVGGLGIYRANPAHGPFVHVDVRGFRARW